LGKIIKRLKQFKLRIKGHYRKSLITILLLSSLPGIVMGFIIFLVINEQVEHELQQTHQNQLFQTAKAIDDNFSTAEMFIAHWTFDPKFNEDLKNIDFRYNYKEIHDIYRTLLIMEGSNPLFGRVELYVNDPSPVVFSKDGYKFLDKEDNITSYNLLLNHSKSVYWINSGNTVGLVHKIPGMLVGEVVPYGALIIYMNQNKVLNLVETLTPHNKGTTFLFEENGQFLFKNNLRDQPTEMDEAIQRKVVKQDSGSGTFLFDWDNQSFSVTYGNFSRLGTSWYYASAALVSSITGPVIFISKIIIGMNLLILLIAGGWAWIASRKLYSPIEKLVQKINLHKYDEQETKTNNEFELIEAQWNNLSRESQILQRRLDRNLPHLREGFLMQLLQGYMHPFTNKELKDRMENFGWDMHNQRFIIVLIQLLGFSKLEGRFSEGDEGLVTFAAANIVEELIESSSIEANVINFHDLSIGLLVSVPGEMARDQLDHELYEISEEIITCIEDMLKMKSTISISRMTDSIKRISVIYDETRLALRFRNLQESSQIIDLEKLNEENQFHDFEYPFDVEKEITYALRLGDEAGALESVRQFMKRMSDKNANEAVMKQSVLQLLGSILHVVLQSRISTHELFEGTDLYSKLSEIREPEEIVNWFEQRIVLPFMAEWSQKKDQHMRKLVEKMIILLNENFMNDISLEFCADEIKISPYVLSKGFKEITGINFIDYLMNIRLERAKQMLRDTEMKISEIAESVGYQHTYFNRLFKKNESLTPSQYREKNQTRSGDDTYE
jgi:AraC-like DNA-binding protein